MAKYRRGKKYTLKRIRSVKNGQFGVRFVPRGPGDPHVCVQVISEDDGNWTTSGDSFSSFWIDDLICALQAARNQLDFYAIWQRDGFGWKFKRV